MKILMTGCTARMVGSQRVAIDYLTVGQLIVMILEKLGHTVTWRAVEPGDDVSGYDLCLVGWAPLLSIGSGRAPGCAWALNQYPDRSVLYAEDWSFGGFGKINSGIIKTTESWRKFLKWRSWKYEERYLNILRETLQSLTPAASCPWPVAVPAYSWGDHGLIFENNLNCDVWDYDPSCLVPRIPFEPTQSLQRSKAWVLSQLSDQTAWLKKLKLTWPVQAYGNKRLGQPVLDEKELLGVYAQNWGMLSSKYGKMTGSGWWRVRYLHAGWVGAIMYCDSIDGSRISESYCLDSTEIENLDQAGLIALARRQEEDFHQHLPTETQLLQTMKIRLETYTR